LLIALLTVGFAPFVERDAAAALLAFGLLVAFDFADEERERAWDLREPPARFAAPLCLV
jgi:hypothetical protein